MTLKRQHSWHSIQLGSLPEFAAGSDHQDPPRLHHTEKRLHTRPGPGCDRLRSASSSGHSNSVPSMRHIPTSALSPDDAMATLPQMQGGRRGTRPGGPPGLPRLFYSKIVVALRVTDVELRATNTGFFQKLSSEQQGSTDMTHMSCF